MLLALTCIVGIISGSNASNDEIVDSSLYGVDECEYIEYSAYNFNDTLLARFSLASSADSCIWKEKFNGTSYSEDWIGCTSDENKWTWISYQNTIYCDSDDYEETIISNGDIVNNTAYGEYLTHDIYCDGNHNIRNCATYAYLFDVDSCDYYDSLRLNKLFDESSFIDTWSLQFGVSGHCGKFYKGPYAPSLDEDGAYFTLDSCINGEAKTKEWGANDDGSGECGDDSESIGFIEFDFIDGNCMTKQEFNQTKIGVIYRDINYIPYIEKDYIMVHVVCGDERRNDDNERKGYGDDNTQGNGYGGKDAPKPRQKDDDNTNDKYGKPVPRDDNTYGNDNKEYIRKSDNNRKDDDYERREDDNNYEDDNDRRLAQRDDYGNTWQ